jgi:uncharacterized damage-inducible protein DinB
MKWARAFLIVTAAAVLILAWEQSAAKGAPPEASPTIASVVDDQIGRIEKQILDVADAMPEDKYDFSPENLKIPGADFEGVRTFAVQLKHVAASNSFLFGTAAGERVPDNLHGGNGPEEVKSKADIVKLVKESFAVGHRAAASLTAGNMLEKPNGGKSTRLYLATFGVAHAFDHYGQMVEYLRMNGIVPPASR